MGRLPDPPTAHLPGAWGEGFPGGVPRPIFFRGFLATRGSNSPWKHLLSFMECLKVELGTLGFPAEAQVGMA